MRKGAGSVYLTLFNSPEFLQKEDRKNRVKSNTPNTYIHDRTLYMLATRTSINSGCFKLVIWVVCTCPKYLSAKILDC
jgi:hypothetical protein